MSLRLYKRSCQVTLITPSRQAGRYFGREGGPQNAIEIKDMRVQFSIEKSVKSDPNKCEVAITNLAEITRDLCQQKPLQVWLDAGYDGELRQLFTGDVRYAYSKLEKPQWTTVLQLGDGDRAYRQARINKTYAAGTPLGVAVQDVARAMDLTVNPADAAKVSGLQVQMLTANATQGFARDELTRLLAPLGVGWSIQNGRLQVLSDSDALPGAVVLVSQDTGMIGSPEYTTPTRSGNPPALKVTMLLYPQLCPGQLIQVHSRAIKDKHFRVQKIRHRGDTHGKEWTTEIEALPAEPMVGSTKVHKTESIYYADFTGNLQGGSAKFTDSSVASGSLNALGGSVGGGE